MGANPNASTESRPSAKLDQYSFGEYIIINRTNPYKDCAVPFPRPDWHLGYQNDKLKHIEHAPRSESLPGNCFYRLQLAQGAEKRIQNQPCQGHFVVIRERLHDERASLGRKLLDDPEFTFRVIVSYLHAESEEI
jgi:hypothetical protein